MSVVSAKVITDSRSPAMIRFATLVVTVPHGDVEDMIRPRELCYSTDVTVNAVGWLPAAPRSFVVSSSKWQTVIEHWMASPRSNLRLLAIHTAAVLSASKSTPLDHGDWHLPFISEADGEEMINRIVADAPQLEFDLKLMYETTLTQLQKVSAARCMTLGRNMSGDTVKRINQDLEQFSRVAEQCGIRLIGYTEHQATPDYCTDKQWRNPHLHANTPGWCQHSQIYPWQVWRDRRTD